MAFIVRKDHTRRRAADKSDVTSGCTADQQHRERALRGLAQLPPFSPVLTRLLATLGLEDVSFSEVAGLIEKDTVLAGQVLRLVNSALYGYRGTVSSVRHAVSLLGVVKLRNTALGLSITRLWTRLRTPANWSNAAFNRHSVATAVLADLLAQRTPVDYAEGAFTAGLLHDVGKLLLAITLPEEYEEVLRYHLNGSASLEECERTAIGAAHAEFSALILERWNLPAPIREAVRLHHAPDESSGLARIVAAANRATNQLGLGVLHPGPADLEDAASILDPVLADEFVAEFEHLREFF